MFTAPPSVLYSTDNSTLLMIDFADFAFSECFAIPAAMGAIV